MSDVTATKTKRKRLKLSEFLAEHGVRYRWIGTWPAFPKALRANEPDPRRTPATQILFIGRPLEKTLLTPEQQAATEKLDRLDERIKRAYADDRLQQAEGLKRKYERLWKETFPKGWPPKFSQETVEVPPDVPPLWVEKIYERIFDKVLPLTKKMSIDFLDAAIFGYGYSSISRELVWRASSAPGTDERKVYEEYRKHYELALDVCRSRVAEVLADWKLPEAADYLKGFAYGIECQHREEGWTPSATTETLQIYKTLVRHQEPVESMTRRNATAKEIGDYVANFAVKSDGMTYARYFEECKKAERKKAAGQFPATASLQAQIGQIRRDTNAEDGAVKAKFLKFFEKICERVGIPLPPPGRPRRNSDTE
jgi:hypothetical protein